MYVINRFTILQTLWPDGVFFTKLGVLQGNAGASQSDKHPTGSADEATGNRKSNTSSFELQLEASRNASEVKKLLLGESIFFKLRTVRQKPHSILLKITRPSVTVQSVKKKLT